MGNISNQLSEHCGMPIALVDRIIRSAPKRYKQFFIPKRNGGLREINQPSKELKVLQRGLIDIVLSKVPINSAATAYRPGLSIRDNALPHAGSGQILKMDFYNFFTSIRLTDWMKYCRDYSLMSPEDATETGQILFMKKRSAPMLVLSMGAPSSPILSNILMKKFDASLTTKLAGLPIRYTRYADDMTFSAPRTGYLNDVRPAIMKVLREPGIPNLKLNDEKTVLATTKFRRSVTGLVLANDGRVTLGREMKRSVRAQVHHALTSKMSLEDIESLSGTLAHINSVDQEFFSVLCRKYGKDRVIAIMRTIPKKRDPK